MITKKYNNPIVSLFFHLFSFKFLINLFNFINNGVICLPLLQNKPLKIAKTNIENNFKIRIFKSYYDIHVHN